MVKRCIILSSSYPKDSFSSDNDEVQEDSLIVRQILNDHEITEITIPCESGSFFSRKIIYRELEKMHFDSPEECHIVLNTHGIPGECDLRLDVIVDLLQYLLTRHVKISQVSALMCDGMTSVNNSINEPVLTTFFASGFRRQPQESSMEMLQKKLNRLVSDIEQKFEIRGFSFAYTPSEQHALVKQLLLGNEGEILEVTINANHFKNTYFKSIKEDLNFISTCQMNGILISDSERNRISNIFAKALNYMKQQISISLDLQEPIHTYSECWPLFKAISDFSEERISDSAIFLQNYNEWIKLNKLFSAERLNVVKKFSELCLTNDGEFQDAREIADIPPLQP